MAYLRRYPHDDARLLDVFRAYPGAARPLLLLHEELMRGAGSPLSVAQRELIAAFVSGVNECAYCCGVHGVAAERFGVEPGLLKRILGDLDTAPVDSKLKPILRYVRKVSRTPDRVTAADAEAVFEAGWDDRALHDAVCISALFNMMNRMVQGLGIVGDEEYFKVAGERLAEVGYAGLVGMIGS